MKKFMTDEKWMPIEGADGYFVSNTGKIKSFRRNKQLGMILVPYIPILNRESKSKGARKEHHYPQILIKWDAETKDRTRLIHRLVAKAFIPNPENLPCVNHKDGNKTNNHVDNLEWVNHSENHKHAFKSGLRTCPVKGELQPLGKLTQKQVDEIRRIYKSGEMSQYRLATKFGINQSNVSRIISGERWVG